MKNVVIWSTGGLAEMVFLLNKECPAFNIVAFCANREYCTSDTFMGMPLIANDELENTYPPNEVEILVCIGFKEMNGLREAISLDLKSRGYVFCNYIHPTAIVSSDVQLGEGNIILEGVQIGIHCKIGDGNVIMECSMLSHNIVIDNYCYISLGVAFGGFVHLHNNCFIGLNATLVPYVILANKTLVGAGVVIQKDTFELEAYASAKSYLMTKKSTDIF
ncbi:MAG: hypothetical protein RR424_07040 [Oscillospiraceae bacterium]